MNKTIRDGRSMESNAFNSIMMILFTLSGVSSLIYEVVWLRQLTLVLGASTHAVTIILAAFMLGLGLGSWLLGRQADRLNGRQLARCYILLEIGIGLYALVLPLILHLNEHIYVVFHQKYMSGYDVSNALRFLLALLVFVIPTTFMGATLPVVARYLIRSVSHVSGTISRLYALNTLGAVLGTLLAGYVLVPCLGNRLTSLIAVAINFTIATVFLLVHKRFDHSGSQEASSPVLNTAEPETKLSALQKSVIWAFAISGAAAMIYEVAWTRILSMILGTTTYAFTTMLATFLLGITIGSVLYGRIRKIAAAPTLFVWLEVIIAFSVVLTIPLFGKLPFLYLSIHQSMGDGWMSVQWVRFFLAALVMIFPTMAMGCIFPVVSDILIHETDALGKGVGRAYGFNTFGSVIGASVAGLVLIPMLGLQRAIVAGAFVNLLAGVLVCLFYVTRSMRYRVCWALGSSLALLVLTGMLKPWSPQVMSSGVYAYTSRYQGLLDRVEDGDEQYNELKQATPWELWDMAMKQYVLLYYNAGPSATVSVMERNDGIRFLTVDGKTDASSNYQHDMKTQVLLGQLPLLYHPEPDRVFVVGLGSGVTVGSILTHTVRTVDCAEISNSVIEAAQYFSEVNHHALEDKRLRIIPRDARNALMTYDKDYDVIISQPSNPWISGQSSLFSYEWYKIVADRLSEGGIFSQWIPAYHMSKQDVKIIIHTLMSVFPHVTAWTSGSAGELILIAKKGEKLEVPYDKFLARAKEVRVQNDIERLGYTVEMLPFWTFVMNEEDISTYLYANLDAPIQLNTDNLLLTEFSTPKQMAEENMVERFSESDHLHGEMDALMKILVEVDMDAMMKLLDAG